MLYRGFVYEGFRRRGRVRHGFGPLYEEEGLVDTSDYVENVSSAGPVTHPEVQSSLSTKFSTSTMVTVKIDQTQAVGPLFVNDSRLRTRF